jgi:hypothetical protein
VRVFYVDEISLTLGYEHDISAFEAGRASGSSWI